MIIKDVDVNYIDYGSKENPMVFLHGWAQNIEMMKMLGDNFSLNHRIIILDLPGFGKSSEPKYAWTLYDYVDFLKEFLSKLDVSNPILVGHSFGGKIALLYSSMYEVSKLVCLASPFKKMIEKDSLKTKILKSAKKIIKSEKLEEFAKKRFGSTDYKNATPMMREILVLHVNLDISDMVTKIKCPTILIWGTLDTEVDISLGSELESKIPDAALITYEGCSHYAYLERLGQTVNIIKSFVGDE